MLNRRKALLTGTALMIGATRLQETSGQAHGRLDRSEKPDAASRSAASRANETAELCAACSTACADLTDWAINRRTPEDSPLTDLIRFSADCRDICRVAAGTRVRRGPLAPAICQASADACARLVAAGRSLAGHTLVDRCCRVADECATACRATISAG